MVGLNRMLCFLPISRRWISWAAIGMCLLAAGCGSSVKAPGVDPATAADKAMELLDKDSNGQLSPAELAGAPGLLSGLAVLDTSSDKQLSREELVAGLTDMFQHGAGLQAFSCRVLLDGRPLNGAHVRLVPEAYLGDTVKIAEGDTDNSGTVALSVAESEMPAKLKGVKAIQPGIYRVEVTHPSAKILPKYNTQTTLGYDRHPANLDTPVVFRLSSR